MCSALQLLSCESATLVKQVWCHRLGGKNKKGRCPRSGTETRSTPMAQLSDRFKKHSSDMRCRALCLAPGVIRRAGMDLR